MATGTGQLEAYSVAQRTLFLSLLLREGGTESQFPDAALPHTIPHEEIDRFLQASDGDCELAVRAFCGTLLWRRDTLRLAYERRRREVESDGPPQQHPIVEANVHQQLTSGSPARLGLEVRPFVPLMNNGTTRFLGFSGFDRHPIVWSDARLSRPEVVGADHQLAVDNTVYMMECLRRVCYARSLPFKIYVLMDFSGWSLKLASHRLLQRLLVTTLMQHYPETQLRTYIVNAPALFQVAWRIFKAFAPANTVRKVSFLRLEEAKCRRVFQAVEEKRSRRESREVEREASRVGGELLAELVALGNSQEELEEFFLRTPREVLPKEYGGDLLFAPCSMGPGEEVFAGARYMDQELVEAQGTTRGENQSDGRERETDMYGVRPTVPQIVDRRLFSPSKFAFVDSGKVRRSPRPSAAGRSNSSRAAGQVRGTETEIEKEKSSVARRRAGNDSESRSTTSTASGTSTASSAQSSARANGLPARARDADADHRLLPVRRSGAEGGDPQDKKPSAEFVSGFAHVDTRLHLQRISDSRQNESAEERALSKSKSSVAAG
eukprot:CAMPEP_0178991834 /NCGR_PEP_ID=MMETSP0795-20121207/5763_1 /TAXON_ID=88552 /ORGANISM="Amoebophrya sp., Strain Ameob2" /LENGTH=549 /DNA_ID=CAMNT_0020683617 /DNA_START=549 /DNA_END=2194 /DNA_ORIENTATION=+